MELEIWLNRYWGLAVVDPCRQEFISSEYPRAREIEEMCLMWVLQTAQQSILLKYRNILNHMLPKLHSTALRSAFSFTMAASRATMAPATQSSVRSRDEQLLRAMHSGGKCCWWARVRNDIPKCDATTSPTPWITDANQAGKCSTMQGSPSENLTSSPHFKSIESCVCNTEKWPPMVNTVAGEATGEGAAEWGSLLPCRPEHWRAWHSAAASPNHDWPCLLGTTPCAKWQCFRAANLRGDTSSGAVACTWPGWGATEPWGHHLLAFLPKVTGQSPGEKGFLQMILHFRFLSLEENLMNTKQWTFDHYIH